MLFPDHFIDPKLKDREWVLKFIKAAFNTYESGSAKPFFSKWLEYQTIKDYAQGKQSIDKHKKLMGVDGTDNTSWMNINWSILPIFPKFRKIALNKLKKMEYVVDFDAVDPIAQAENDKYFNKQRAKIMMRDQMDPQVAQELGLSKLPGEPEDLEELEIQKDFTHKHNRAIEMEQLTRLVFMQNDAEEIKSYLRECLFDYGVAAVKEFIEGGKVKIKAVNPVKLIVSHCENRNFSDKMYAGEVYEISPSELKKVAGDQFTAKEYENILESCKGRWGNSRRPIQSDSSEKFKIRVVDLEFFSINDMVYERRTNGFGNKVFARSRYKGRKVKSSKYVRYSPKVVYAGKWIEGTDYIYDYGLQTDMKRASNPKKMKDTDLSYHIFAPDFHEMRFVGITEQCMPIVDGVQIAWLKLQQAIAEARPKGIAINLDAIEDVQIGKALDPMGVLDLYTQKGTLVYRLKDQNGGYSDKRPIEELQGGIGDEAQRWFMDIQNKIQLIRDTIGMNELTDASSPDARTLTTIAHAAQEGTNNALYQVVEGEHYLMKKVAENVSLRVQDIAKNGGMSGYVTAVGKGTKEFVESSTGLGAHEFGIKIIMKPSDSERQELKELMITALGQQTISFADAIFIKNIDHTAIAEQVLAYRIKKRKEEQAKESERLQMMNAEVNSQTAERAEAAKQQTIQLEYELKSQIVEQEKTWDYKIKMLEVEGGITEEQRKGEVKISADALKMSGSEQTGVENS